MRGVGAWLVDRVYVVGKLKIFMEIEIGYLQFQCIIFQFCYILLFSQIQKQSEGFCTEMYNFG